MVTEEPVGGRARRNFHGEVTVSFVVRSELGELAEIDGDFTINMN